MNEQTRQRLLNLEALVEAGFQPYPYRYPKTHSAKEILSAKEGAPPESEWEEEVALAGRIVALRRMGKVTFAHLLDESGKIQLYFQKDLTPSYELLKKLDVGDILGVKGTVFTTKTGEVTVKVLSWTPLVKSLHPLPD
ncbi:OB-fold nucleic acid binding domain-containing protein, partial [Thermus sp.]